MIPLQGEDPFYLKFIDVHRDLHGLVEAVEKQVRAAESDQTAWSRLPELLERLFDHLKQHFAEEELGGVLEEAMSRLPRLCSRVAVVERQHDPLLQQLGQVVERARTCPGSVENWRSIADDFQRFTYALRAHEGAENRIAAEAFGKESCHCH
jgi:iron-sulfur cluster repair protein YtfE (RIC family)